jgi:hypothetical protein
MIRKLRSLLAIVLMELSYRVWTFAGSMLLSSEHVEPLAEIDRKMPRYYNAARPGQRFIN